jgi:ABC-type multidrug transport system ATPase subunit
MAIELNNVLCRASATGTGDAGVAGVSLEVPPGQSLALLSRPHGTATALLDVIAGLRRPRAGELRVDGAPMHPDRAAALG